MPKRRPDSHDGDLHPKRLCVTDPVTLGPVYERASRMLLENASSDNTRLVGELQTMLALCVHLTADCRAVLDDAACERPGCLSACPLSPNIERSFVHTRECE